MLQILLSFSSLLQDCTDHTAQTLHHSAASSVAGGGRLLLLLDLFLDFCVLHFANVVDQLRKHRIHIFTGLGTGETGISEQNTTK